MHRDCRVLHSFCTGYAQGGIRFSGVFRHFVLYSTVTAVFLRCSPQRVYKASISNPSAGVKRRAAGAERADRGFGRGLYRPGGGGSLGGLGRLGGV